MTEIPPSPNFANGALLWAPDGERLLGSSRAAATPAELYVVDPRSPDPYRLVFRTAVGEQIRGAAWAADGSTIVLGLERARSDIVLLSAD